MRTTKPTHELDRENHSCYSKTENTEFGVCVPLVVIILIQSQAAQG